MAIDSAGEMSQAKVAMDILCLLMKEQWSWLCSKNIQRTVRLLFGTLINSNHLSCILLRLPAPTASLTDGVYDRHRQPCSHSSDTEARNMVHSDSVSPSSSGTCSKFSQRKDLELCLTGLPDVPSNPHNTFGLPTLTGILPHLQS
ncbi:hypothetical protein CCH79_00018780 [Gambusia affinis]|uniref:Uncharacterized protein n=1 Tax=Gambusia affinis TaxID=33528 RepID=A0A315WBJ4_GAMAF|nr:hypothetical protein CCH79_00018780 [Gambusia affinis]